MKGIAKCHIYQFPSSPGELANFERKCRRVSVLNSPLNDFGDVHSPSGRILKVWDVRYTTPAGRRRKTGTTGTVKHSFNESRDLTALTVKDDAAGDVGVTLGRSRAITDVVVHPTGSVAWGLGKNGRFVHCRSAS